MRYAPSARLKYSSDIAVPALTSDFGEKLKLIKEHATDRAAALKLAKAKKGLANEYKRSIGKSVMVRKLKLVEERIAEEETLVQVSIIIPGSKVCDLRLSHIRARAAFPSFFIHSMHLPIVRTSAPSLARFEEPLTVNLFSNVSTNGCSYFFNV